MSHTAPLTQPHNLSKDLHSGTPLKNPWCVQQHGDPLGKLLQAAAGASAAPAPWQHPTHPYHQASTCCRPSALLMIPQGHPVCHKPDLSVCEGAGGDEGAGGASLVAPVPHMYPRVHGTPSGVLAPLGRGPAWGCSQGWWGPSCTQAARTASRPTWGRPHVSPGASLTQLPHRALSMVYGPQPHDSAAPRGAERAAEPPQHRESWQG